jgi:predicted DCC family thiol-disulfide oxidoreductase YuxK
MQGGHPLVLFDGVCNLCNAAVQWLIERDPDGRLHYASLQSVAAREALTAAGVDDPTTLPDSIVLIDDAGVHVRSTAALRIAGELGFPYNLSRAALLIPRVLRDVLYHVVARYRYRWFGRRDMCMRPTPELASRFRDADEPVVPVLWDRDRHDPVDVSPGQAGGWASSLLRRFAVAYLLVYMLPFPLTLLTYLVQLPLLSDLPGLGTVIGFVVSLYGQVLNPTVAWVGQHIFGVEATPAGTGSGDRTFNYVMLVVQLGLAVAVSCVWTAAAGRRPIGARTFDASRVIARYYLGTTLLTYGWVKVFPLQFPLPGPERLMQPYGDSSPMGIAWAFLGASQGYQIFSGLAELTGGYLLFWRRTALVGALVSAAVLTNIMAINYFYDVPVKLFSTHLFLTAIFIMAPDLPRLAGLFAFNLPTTPRTDRRFWTSTRRSSLAFMLAHVALIGIVTAVNVIGNMQRARSFGYLMERPEVYGIYRVESFERDGLLDRDNDDDVRWVKVGLTAPSLATIQWATGDSERMRLAYDEEARTMSFFDRGGQAPDQAQFTFTFPEPGLVRLEGIYDGHPMTVVLRLDDQGSLLLERGFHWINEFPFNR